MPGPQVAGAPPPLPDKPEDIIRAVAQAQGIDPDFALSIAQTESSMNPNTPRSIVKGQPGAIGLMQLMPPTAAKWGVNPNDPYDNVVGGVKELRALSDQYRGDLELMARRYNGSPSAPNSATDAYAVKVLTDYERRKGLAPGTLTAHIRTSAVGVPPAPPPQENKIRAATWSEQHPYLSGAFLKPFDPRNPEGRQNIAGGVGSIVGGTIGAGIGAGGGVAAGIEGGPLAAVPATVGGVRGAKIGSALGATAGGALEQLAEETGWLPNTPTPAADSTMGGRVTQAGLTQGGLDIAGQAAMWPIRMVGKRALQSGIAKAAGGALQDAREVALTQMRAAFDLAKSNAELLTVARNRAARAVGETIRTGVEDATAAGKTALRTVRDTSAAGIRQARAALDSMRSLAGQRGAAVAETGQAGIQAAKGAGEAGIEEAKAAAERALAQQGEDYAATIAERPSEEAAGRAVSDIYEGPATAARNALGQAVEAAAETGPSVDFRPIKDEARRIAREELLPPAETFPRQPVATPPTGVPAGGSTLATPDPLAQLTEEINAAQLTDLKAHPAMRVIARILNAADDVPFKDLHLLKAELDAANSGVHDAVVKNKVQAITQHLTGLIRQGLSGHEPYNAATAAYAKVAPHFTEGLAPLVKEVRRSGPERIVQAIKVNNPTAARHLVEVLTTHAEAGGGAEGKAAGQEALGQLRRAWVQRNILEGPIGSLGDRLAKVQRAQEFTKAFLGDTASQEVLANIEAVAKAHAEALRQVTASQAAAKTGAKAGVESATTAAKTAAQKAEGLSAEQIRQATEGVGKAAATGRAAVRTEQERLDAEALTRNRAGRATVETTRRAGESQRLTTSAELRDLRKQIALRLAGTPEEKAFERSTLGSQIRDPNQVAADVVNVAARGIVSRFGALGLVRLLHGASDADVLRYVVHSKGLTKALTKLFVSSTLTKASPAVAGAAFKAGKGAYQASPPPPPPPPKRRP